jgi:uncharacterized membrane protein
MISFVVFLFSEIAANAIRLTSGMSKASIAYSYAFIGLVSLMMPALCYAKQRNGRALWVNIIVGLAALVIADSLSFYYHAQFVVRPQFRHQEYSDGLVVATTLLIVTSVVFLLASGIGRLAAKKVR